MKSPAQKIRTKIAAAIAAAAMAALGGCMQSTSSTVAQSAPIIKAEAHPAIVSLGVR